MITTDKRPYSDLAGVFEQHPAHAGLQAAAPEKTEASSEQDAPYVVVGEEGKDKEQQQAWQSPQNPRRRRICGLQPIRFLICVAVASIVVIGAVAGGLAGGLTQKDHNSGAPSSAQAESSALSGSMATPSSTAMSSTT